jgi:UDP-N-acetylmuramyl pentapeptide phosphotransferase/UDP-N-acetylglucosamine-1-phosphate transferase
MAFWMYPFIFILLIVAELLYFRTADSFNIIDKPNQRSSHSKVTIRGGGIIFPIAALLWFITNGFEQSAVMSALVIMSIISFWDDVSSLSPKIRITLHLISVSILFYQTQVLSLPWYIVLLAFILVIGWINAFNFMDGINGITAFYGLSTLVTMFILNNQLHFAPDHLIEVLVISVLVFTFFNARKKAKAFAGDVGSVSMAFILVWLMLLLMFKTNRVEYILFWSVYGIDSALTIFFRLLKRENIFEAHRSHLYQYLANELRWPHVRVSAIYAIIQLAINWLVIMLMQNEIMNISLMLLLLFILSTIYLGIRILVVKRLKLA